AVDDSGVDAADQSGGRPVVFELDVVEEREPVEGLGNGAGETDAHPRESRCSAYRSERAGLSCYRHARLPANGIDEERISRTIIFRWRWSRQHQGSQVGPD